MKAIELPTTAADLAALFGADISGDPHASVSRLSSLAHAGHGALSFFSDLKYGEDLRKAAGAVVFSRAENVRAGCGITFLVVPDPRGSFAEVANSFRRPPAWQGMPSQSHISELAIIDPSAQIGPGVFIGPGAKIGARTRVFPFVYVGADVTIGEGCDIHPHVTLHDGVTLGNRVQIFAGAVIGSAGFGFFRSGNTGPYREMPHIGTVVIEDDVRLGANVTIDRGTLEETRIGRGTKTDDHAHVGHNVQIKENVILCAFAVIGGSAVLEKDVVLGGAVGIGQGVTIGEGARFAGQAGSTTNVPKGVETYFFNPPIPIREFSRIYRGLRKLPKLFKRVKELESILGEKRDG